MSFDSYFCVCCLSTDDLTDLFGNNDGKIYTEMLKNNFAIKICPEEFYEESYICNLCCSKLIETNSFKIMILQTIHTMEVNGLVKLENIKDYTVIKKVDDLDFPMEDKEKVNLQAHGGPDIALDITIENLNPISKQIKEENIDEKFFELLEVSEEIIKSDLTKDSERQKEINIFNINSNRKTELDKTVTYQTKTETVTEPDKPVTEEDKIIINQETVYKVNTNLKCDICSLQLPNTNAYHRHMNRHFSHHICEVCGKGFSTIKRLKRHKTSHIIGIFKCMSCDAEFKNYNTLQSHRSSLHGEKSRYKCSKCDERFLSFHKRMKHLADVHGENERKYKCSMCPSDFMTSGNLNGHIRQKHLKIKRYICSECGTGYFQKQDLRSHVQTHTGIKEFKCTICNKTFLRKKTLTVHMRIHTNEKRFSCDTCGKKFIQKCSLQRHFKLHEKVIKTSSIGEKDRQRDIQSQNNLPMDHL